MCGYGQDAPFVPATTLILRTRCPYSEHRGHRITHLNLGGESCPTIHDQIKTTPTFTARRSNDIVPVRLTQRLHGNFAAAVAGFTNGFIIAPTILGAAFARRLTPPPSSQAALGEKSTAHRAPAPPADGHRQALLCLASVGARRIQKEWCRRYPRPV